MQMNRCFGSETILPTSIPRKSAFTLETQVLRLFTFCRFLKCSKPPQSTFWVQCSRMDALVTILCLRNHVRNFGTRNGAFRHETHVFHLFTFCTFQKCSENTTKQHFRSNADEWMLWLQNHICNFGTPK
jgi:CRISPR/Cas system endoribonuclease Cas6 (RAMP superfamily)